MIWLSELEARTGKRCDQVFNFFGGTSIGAIISMGLAKGLSAENLLYDFLGRTRNQIFSTRHYMRYILGLRSNGTDQLSHPLYDKEGLEQELSHFFSDIKLIDIPNNILTTSCAIENDKLKPCIFVKF